MIDPTVAQQLEMLNRTGALAAAFLAGWVCCLISLWTGLRAMRRIRQHRLASRMGPPRGSYGPRQPEQPLAADLIRYSRWRSEQIERALRDEPPTPN